MYATRDNRGWIRAIWRPTKQGLRRPAARTLSSRKEFVKNSSDGHGVEGLETRRVAGVQGSVAMAGPSPIARAIRGATDLVRLTRPSIASGTERRTKTFWEVAASAGLRTAVVNWWATWPASPEAGIVLSDRATLRLERGGPLDAELSPAILYDTLRQQWAEIRTRAESRAATAIDFNGEEAARTIRLIGDRTERPGPALAGRCCAICRNFILLPS